MEWVLLLEQELGPSKELKSALELELLRNMLYSKSTESAALRH